MLFNAYLDDSGTHAASKIISVGGCINEAETLDNFSRAWQERLDKWKLPFFHMTDWAALRGDYKTWSKPVAERRLRELLDLIRDFGIGTFGVAVSRKEFSGVSAMYPKAKRRCGGAYGYLGQRCLVQLREMWGGYFEDLGNGGDTADVSYYFEDGTAGYGAIEKAWYRARETVLWRDVLITRLRKQDSPPLQAADIVAYELRELYPLAAGWVPKGDARYPVRQLGRGAHIWQYVTGSLLREHIQNLAGE